MVKVVGIDPGVSGYQCLLTHYPRPLLSPAEPPSHLFWPAPRNDVESRYELGAMVELCRSWAPVSLVILEAQAPRPHGKGRLQKESPFAAFASGVGFGAWQASLVAAGFSEIPAQEAPLAFRSELHAHRQGKAKAPRYYVIVEPMAWKARMGCLATGVPGESDAARRARANARTCEVAARIAPSVDLRALERTPKARTPSPDKSASLLLAHYGLRWIAGVEEEKKERQ